MKTIKQLWTQQSSGNKLSESSINVFFLFFLSLHYISLADRIAQLVQRLGYRLDDLGFKFWQKQEIFLFSKASQTSSDAHPSLIINGFQDSLPGVMQPEHDADHPPPSTAEVRNERSHISTSFICLHRMHIDNFTFVTYHQFWQPILNNSFLTWTMLFQLQTLYSSAYGNMIIIVKNSKVVSLLCLKV